MPTTAGFGLRNSPPDDGAKLLKTSTLEQTGGLVNDNDVGPSHWGTYNNMINYPSCTFSPDGKLVAISGLYREGTTPFWSNWLPAKLDPFPYDHDGSVVRVWDVGTAKEVMAIEGASEATFSPAGTVLATLHYPQTVKLWHVPFRKPLWRILAWAAPFWLVIFTIYRLFVRVWRRSVQSG